jgi:hypothetical protein
MYSFTVDRYTTARVTAAQNNSDGSTGNTSHSTPDSSSTTAGTAGSSTTGYRRLLGLAADWVGFGALQSDSDCSGSTANDCVPPHANSGTWWPWSSNTQQQYTHRGRDLLRSAGGGSARSGGGSGGSYTDNGYLYLNWTGYSLLSAIDPIAYNMDAYKLVGVHMAGEVVSGCNNIAESNSSMQQASASPPPLHTLGGGARGQRFFLCCRHQQLANQQDTHGCRIPNQCRLCDASPRGDA